MPDVSFRPWADAAPSISELLQRRDHLVECAHRAELGDTELVEIFEVGIRGEQKLARRETRLRVNRSAAVMYWREVRATEEKIASLAAGKFSLEPVDIHIMYDPGPLTDAPPSAAKPELPPVRKGPYG